MTISESPAINMTIYENNKASLEGTTISIQKFHFYKSNFTNNIAENGGALSITGETIVIQNSCYNSNTAKKHGGALQIHGQFVNVTGSHYFNNTAGGDGGAINITSDNLHVATSNFSSNSARNGGAISVNKRLQRHMYFDIFSFEEIIIAINSSTFVDNSALLGFGGALHIKGVDLNIGFNIFKNNSALGGGAVCNKGLDNNINLQTSNFLYNHANSKGGALLLFSYHVTLSQCIFRGNFANLMSGGAIMSSAFFLNVFKCTFSSNRANMGSGLSIINTNWTSIIYSKFIQNKATMLDGGVITTSGMTLDIFSCNFSNNVGAVYYGTGRTVPIASFTALDTNFTTDYAKSGGAIIIHEICNVILWSCHFHNNTSEGKGGAVCIINSRIELIFIAKCTFKNNSAAARGGAFAFEANYYFTIQRYNCSSIIERVDKVIDKMSTLPPQELFNLKSMGISSYFSFTIIVNCTFSYNIAKDQNSRGGAISVQGKHFEDFSAIETSDFDHLTLVNSDFIKNSAQVGGAIYCYTSEVFIKIHYFMLILLSTVEEGLP